MDLFHASRVRLSALTRADIPVLTCWHDDPEFLRLWDSRAARPKSEQEIHTWLDELGKAQDTVTFAIRPPEGDALLGMVELDGIEWQHGTCYLGIGIGERTNWGKGYGSEALGLVLRYAFHELNLHRISVTVFDNNLRSLALFEKHGFVREGVYREFVLRDGERHDMLLYGLLQREWLARQQDFSRES